jgi:hypothetical protein
MIVNPDQIQFPTVVLGCQSRSRKLTPRELNEHRKGSHDGGLDHDKGYLHIGIWALAAVCCCSGETSCAFCSSITSIAEKMSRVG